MISVPFFASTTTFGSKENLLSLPFQAQMLIDLANAPKDNVGIKKLFLTCFRLSKSPFLSQNSQCMPVSIIGMHHHLL